MSFSNLFYSSNNNRFDSFKVYIYNLYNQKITKLTNEEYKTIYNNIILYREKCFYQNLEKLIIMYHCDYVWLNYGGSDSEDNFESIYLPLIESFLKDENMQIEPFNNISIEQRHNFEIIETIIQNNILNFNSEICKKIINKILNFIKKQREFLILKRLEDSSYTNTSINSTISNNNNNNNTNNNNNGLINFNYYFIYLLKSIIIFKSKIGLKGYEEFKEDLYQFFNDLFIIIPTSKVRKDMILLFEFSNFIKDLDGYSRRIYSNLLLKASTLNDFIHVDPTFQKKYYNELLVAISIDTEIFQKGFQILQEFNYIIEPLLKECLFKIKKFNQFLFELKVNKQYFPNSLESILATLEFSISIPIVIKISNQYNWCNHGGGGSGDENNNNNNNSSHLFKDILIGLLKKCESNVLRSLFNIDEDLIEDKEFLKQLYQDTLERLLKSRNKLFESSVESIFSNLTLSNSTVSKYPIKLKFIQDNLQFFLKKLYIGQIDQFILPIFKDDCENSQIYQNKSIIKYNTIRSKEQEEEEEREEEFEKLTQYYKKKINLILLNLFQVIQKENILNEKKDENDNNIMELLQQLNNIPNEKNLIREKVSMELDQYLFPSNGDNEKTTFNNNIKKDIEQINNKEKSLIERQVLLEKESTNLIQQLKLYPNKKIEKKNQINKTLDQLMIQNHKNQLLKSKMKSNCKNTTNLTNNTKTKNKIVNNQSKNLPNYLQSFIISLLFQDLETSQFTKLSISLVSKKFLQLSINEMNSSTTIPISINYRYNFKSSLVNGSSLLKSNVKYLKYSFNYKKKYRHYFYHDYDERLNEELELINSVFNRLEILDLRKCEINDLQLSIFNQPNNFKNLKILILKQSKNYKIINEKQKELNLLEKRIQINIIN